MTRCQRLVKGLKNCLYRNRYWCFFTIQKCPQILQLVVPSFRAEGYLSTTFITFRPDLLIALQKAKHSSIANPISLLPPMISLPIAFANSPFPDLQSLYYHLRVYISLAASYE